MLARFKQLKKSDLPLHRAIISDITLWVTLALVLALGIYWFAIRMPEQNGQTILLKFRDANQITRGSAVTMLGTDVGYVKNIRIHNDHIDVLVQTFSKSLSIPSGATFTVLFNGLAGSKSIDIEVPKAPLPEMNGKPIYTVAEPIRLKTLLDYMVDMTQALTVGAENITDFFGKKKPVEELQFNIHQAHLWTLDSLKYADLIQTDMRQFQHDINEGTRNGVQTLNRFNKRSKWLIQYSSPEKIRPQISSALLTLRNIRNAFVPSSSCEPTAYTYLENWNQTTSKINRWIRQTSLRTSQFPLAQILDRIETGEDQFIQFLDNVQAYFQQCPGQNPLEQLRLNIQAFNRQVLALSFKMEGNTSSTTQTQPKSPYTPCCPPLKPAPSIRPPRPTSSGIIKPFPIVDHGGITQKHPNAWWYHHPAANRGITASTIQAQGKYIPPQTKEEPKPALFVPLLQGMNNFASLVWDSLVAFFTS